MGSPSLGLLFGVSFLQRPGRITFDTKFDLTADPGEFLERTLHLWNPALSFGELQNQAYGYLFPQGALLLARRAGSGSPTGSPSGSGPASVLVMAYEGARRLFRALFPEPPRCGDRWPGWRSRSPRASSDSSGCSSARSCRQRCPWVVLPLVLAFQGRLEPRAAGLLSGCAVLLMGGVNAVEDVAALPLPALVAASSGSGRRPAAGCRVVGAGVALASAWWMLPLLVLGRYSPPFLDYIETAAATTFPLGWTNVVRGADHWVAFMSVGGRPGGRAPTARVEPWLVAVTGVVAAVGLSGSPGRCRCGRPSRSAWCSASAADGRARERRCPARSPKWSRPPRRSAGDAAQRAQGRPPGPAADGDGVRARRHAVARRVGSVVASRPQGLALTAGALVVLLLASAQPALAGELRKGGGARSPRPGWRRPTTSATTRTGADPGPARVGLRAATLGLDDRRADPGRGETPWVTRSQVPLVPGATIRFLDGLEERIQDGRGSPALADTLARAGISTSWCAATSTSTPVAPRARPGSPWPWRGPGPHAGRPVRPTGFGNQPALVVYTRGPGRTVVEAVDRDDVATLTGGPEDVITALESGLLGGDTPVVIGTGETLGRAGDRHATGTAGASGSSAGSWTR